MPDLQYMLDTNVFIHATKGTVPITIGRLSFDGPGSVVSSVSYAELLFGQVSGDGSKAQAAMLEKIEAYIQVVPFDAEAARHYADIKLALKKTPIGDRDLMIGAHARSLGLVLATNNVREFARIPNLKVEDWAERRSVRR